MGLSNGNSALILMAMRNARAPHAVATIGKQTFWPSREFLSKALAATGSDLTAEKVFSAVGPQRDGSEFFRLLGARHVDEVDASDYEGASIIHDMNQPIPQQHRERYDVVFDGGSLEHIFDVRQALQNIGDLLKVGGLYVGSTCANNMLGHGFYQFSPELFYRYLCPENGWKSTAVFLCEHEKDPPRFWFVEDPRSVGRRILVQTGSQLYLQVVAEKTSNPATFTVPQQSDYVAAWSGRASSAERKTVRPFAGLLRRGKSLLRGLGLQRLRYLLPRRSRNGLLDLSQPGIQALTTESFLGYSLRS